MELRFNLTVWASASLEEDLRVAATAMYNAAPDSSPPIERLMQEMFRERVSRRSAFQSAFTDHGLTLFKPQPTAASSSNESES